MICSNNVSGHKNPGIVFLAVQRCPDLVYHCFSHIVLLTPFHMCVVDIYITNEQETFSSTSPKVVSNSCSW